MAYVNQQLNLSFGTVMFGSEPEGALIYVDGQVLTDEYTGAPVRTPGAAYLPAGRRDIVYRTEDGKEVKAYVDVFPNRKVEIYRRVTSPGGKIPGYMSNMFINSLQISDSILMTTLIVSFIGSLAAIYIAKEYLK